MGAKGEFMSANLAWFEAMAIVGRVFTAGEQKAGWPPALKPAQIGRLQRPCASTDETGWRFAVALVNAIDAACTAGEIEHSTATEHIRKELLRTWLMGEPAPPRTYRLIPYEVKLITAQAFANWLAAQQIEPSQHIRAWFAANGISVPEVPKAAPVQGMAAAQGEAAPVQPAAAPRRIVKREVLVKELKGEWLTIVSDLKQAANNGLKAAAHNGHAWNIEAARRWAEEHGKLVDPNEQVAPVKELEKALRWQSTTHKCA